MMFHPILMKCNEYEGSLPCQEPLKEELLVVSGEVEVAHGNGPSEGAALQACKWPQSLQLQSPAPRQISLEPVEDVRT